MEAIILAGGFGTRLQGVVSDVPKPMAPVNDKPFLQYVIKTLAGYGYTHVILSVGYLSEKIIEYFGEEFAGVKISYAKEEEPLGTGGGIKLALAEVSDDDVLVLNGDTFFGVDYKKVFEDHKNLGSDITLTLKPMENFDRYGTVKTDGQRVISFEEKKFTEYGMINTGSYVMKRSFLDGSPDGRFSFEEYIKEAVDKQYVAGLSYDDDFIDIGIPEDYKKAQLIPQLGCK